MAAITSQWWRRLVNAYEVKAGITCLQCKNCVIHNWALQRWASYDGALYKSMYLYLYLYQTVLGLQQNFVIIASDLALYTVYFLTLSLVYVTVNLWNQLHYHVMARNLLGHFLHWLKLYTPLRNWSSHYTNWLNILEQRRSFPFLQHGEIGRF